MPQTKSSKRFTRRKPEHPADVLNWALVSTLKLRHTAEAMLLDEAGERASISTCIALMKELPKLPASARRVLEMRAEVRTLVGCDCGGLLVFGRHFAHCDSCSRKLFVPLVSLASLRRAFPERRQD
ncbi:MAG: hypothetical protein AB7V46_16810 [Thermomicrobiales bacterium]